MSKLIDTHFHLDHYKDHQMKYREINDLKQYTLCMTNTPGIFLSCKKLYSETKYIKFALGVHPYEVNSLNIIEEFRYCFNKTQYIGEVGLDFSSKYMNNKEVQLNVFNEIIKVSSNSNKLISVHSKKSEDAIIEILSKNTPNKCIIHWFNGKKHHLEQLVELGCYFSLNAGMFNRSSEVELLKNIPKNKILIESDGPYTKVYDKKFVPKELESIYVFIEETLKICDLKEVVFENFKELLQK